MGTIQEAHSWGFAVCIIKDYKDVNGSKAKHKENLQQQWEPLPEGFYHINMDGAIPLTNGQSGVGMII